MNAESKVLIWNLWEVFRIIIFYQDRVLVTCIYESSNWLIGPCLVNLRLNSYWNIVISYFRLSVTVCFVTLIVCSDGLICLCQFQYSKNGSVTALIWGASPQTRSDRRKDRVETNPEQLAAASAQAEISLICNADLIWKLACSHSVNTHIYSSINI